MAYCSKCGKEIHDDAYICVNCGCKVAGKGFFSSKDGKNTLRFLLTFLLGFLGSFIINHTGLKRDGYKSRTCAYFFLGILTFGIYNIVASVYNFAYDENSSSNIGYFRD